MRPKIVLAHKVDHSVISALSAVGDVVVNETDEPLPRHRLIELCRDASAVMVFMSELIDRPFLCSCPRLKIIAGALKGADNIDVAACKERGIVVTVVPDLLAEPTAELTLALMIAVARNLITGDRLVRLGRFAGWRPQLFGGSLCGATVGIIGAGSVGQAIVRVLSAFRGQRLVFDIKPGEHAVPESINTHRVTLDTLLRDSDFVVLAVPLTNATTGMVDTEFVSRMKPGAYLINPARGSLVDESAVAAALAEGHLAGYAADTFAMEDWARPDRPRAVHPSLLASGRTVFTPHLGSAVTEVRKSITASAAESIVAVLSRAELH